MNKHHAYPPSRLNTFLLASLFAISHSAFAFNTTLYKVTVKNSTAHTVVMRPAADVGDKDDSTEGQCVNIDANMKDVSIDSGQPYTFEMSFKGGETMQMPDGDSSYGAVPIGCTKGNPETETGISFDFNYHQGTSLSQLGQLYIKDYSDSGDIMRCSAINAEFQDSFVSPGSVIMRCSNNGRDGDRQTVTVHIENLPAYPGASE